tara:strand:- start:47201 stop:47968 length:768 start_codon:yes stop_codon:yes gene_type:complete
MGRLYIFDLEGTTGIFNKGEREHINNTVILRPGFRESLSYLNKDNIHTAIATRAPRKYTDDIIGSFEQLNVGWQGEVYSKTDICFADHSLMPYKDLGPIYSEHGIDDPAGQVVIIGDFLRFGFGNFSKDMYRSFDFNRFPEFLSSNCALNDHPFPNGKDTPVYVVVPQPWSTVDDDGYPCTLDMQYVVSRLEKMYEAGGNNFRRGFDVFEKSGMKNTKFVRSNHLARRLLGIDHEQAYLVMQGREEDWQSLELLR